jgi:hypothetical protein
MGGAGEWVADGLLERIPSTGCFDREWLRYRCALEESFD